MEKLSYNQDGNSGFIIQSETNDQIGVVWTDTEDEEEINEAEKLTKLFIASPKLLDALQQLLIVKEYKDKNGKDEIYLKSQPIAWELAKKAVLEALS